MPLNFEHFAQKGNEYLNLLAEELGKPGDKQFAARVTRAVFRTLRDILTIEESIQLVSQLPMALKAAYVEGWKPRKVKSIKTELDFLNNVVKEERLLFVSDFKNNYQVHRAVISTFKVLRNYISEGEFEDIKAVLPTAIKPLIQESLNEKIISTENGNRS